MSEDTRKILRKRILAELVDVITYDKERKLDKILDEVFGKSSGEKCSYCGETGHSIQQCLKWKLERATHGVPLFTKQHLEKLLRFRSLVDYAMFERMYVDAGGSRQMAEHLWNKLQRYNVDILVWFAELDIENSERFVTMLNAWSGLVPIRP